MSEEPLIRVDGVSKKFCLHLKRSLWYGLQDVGREMVGRQRDYHLRKDEFWAIDDVSFTVNRGEILGLVGHNGCGKTTMLRLINGLILPDKGEITVRGRVGALIQLGAGFSEILSGRENIHINAAVLSIPTAEINRKLDDIIEFADIGKFIDSPVRTYSSGMRARLGFAVAIHMNPDILLVDEVLAVGDLNFRIKAMERMLSLANSGVAVVFISHNLGQVNRICNSAVLLKGGKLVCKKPTIEVLTQYMVGDQSNRSDRSPMKYFPGTEQHISLTDPTFLDANDQPISRFVSGAAVAFCLKFEAKRFLELPLFSIVIEPVNQEAAAVVINQSCNPELRISFAPGLHALHAKLPTLPLTAGNYNIRVNIFESPTGAIALGQVENVFNFDVEPKPYELTISNQGCIMNLDAQWESGKL